MAALFLGAVAALAALLFRRLWISPLRALSEMAERLARGEHEARVLEGSGGELGRLSSAMNLLASNIQGKWGELAREKGQLSSILENMVEAVVAIDEAGRVLAVNPALTDLFGVTAEAARGRLLLEALRHSRLDELARATTADGQRRFEEVRLFAPDERVFEAHAVPLSEGARRAGAMLVLHDITRLRRLEAVRREFVANVSHELRTPLASIKGFAETLRAGALDDRDHRDEFLAEIEQSADRLSRLVDDILDLSAIESGQRKPVPADFDALELAREAAASLKPQAEARRIRMLIDSGSCPARGDRGQIKQVLTNLIDNALKYNRDGGSVELSAAPLPDGVRVTVRDTGQGIPAEDLPRIFERFYRVEKDRSRESGGTGLGLSIVKHLVEGHGGSVSAESIPGTGSTFRFTLPA